MDANGIISRATSDDLSAASDDICIGQMFRQARLRAGFDLDKVSADLKISVEYLQAIEDMDRAAMPHHAYAVGFVRCYAQYLGFNAKSAVESFNIDNKTATTNHRDISAKPAPFWLEFSVPRGFGIMVAVVGILGLVTWYGQQSTSVSHVVPPVPELLGTWSQGSDLRNVPAISSEPVFESTDKPVDG